MSGAKGQVINMTKSIAIMQPYLFPYIGYFQLMNAVDTFVMLDSVNFIKKGWINRNRILVNNQPYFFNFNCAKISQNKLIRDTALDKDTKSAEKFQRALELNYRKAPFFETVSELISDICSQDCEYIADLIRYSFQKINAYLGITTTLIPTSECYNNELRGQERIIDICKTENATCYINAIGGTELYDKALFDANGINLKFLKPQEIKYKQFTSEFVPWLSIIDVMMFNSTKKIKEFLESYILI